MEAIAKMIECGIDYNQNKTKITLLLDKADIDVLNKLKEAEKLNMSLTRWYKKRSIDANAYCWLLCDKIAKELSNDGAVITKEMVYRDAILQVGTFESMVISEKAFKNFKRVWEGQGIGYFVHQIASKDKCIKFHAYYGSHTYNSKEMSLIINLLVQTAKEYDIETMPENELKSLLESWDKK